MKSKEETRKGKLTKKISDLFHNPEPKSKSHRECHSHDMRSLTMNGEISRQVRKDRGESFNENCLTQRNQIQESQDKSKGKRSSSHHHQPSLNSERDYYISKKYEGKPKRESSRPNPRIHELSSLLKKNPSKRTDKSDRSSIYEPKSLSSRVHNDERYSKLLNEISQI